MKKGYAKLFIFEVIITIILILNSFLWNILSNYYMVTFLIINIIIFNIFFGVEKDRHRYIKDLIIDILIILLIFFLIYYLSGIIIGFAKTDNYYTKTGLINFIIPIILSIIIKEYLRYQILLKTEGSKTLFIISICLFILLDITNNIYYTSFISAYSYFRFISLILLPSITSNIMLSYLSIKTGYMPNIIYLIITTMYSYLLPIIPNYNEYLYSIIWLIFPLIVLHHIYHFFLKIKDEPIISRKKTYDIPAYILVSILVITLTYFTSGYFHYYAIAVGSGSMSPQINKGDVIIIEKIDEDYTKLKIGQVIAYTHNDIIVIHRLTQIIYDRGTYYFYTKGDANENEDEYIIEEEMIIGIVNIRIPYIGIPTVLLNEI